MAKDSKSVTKGESFQSVPVLTLVGLVAFFVLLEIFCYQPSLLPCDSLGKFGDYLCYFVKEYHTALTFGFWISVSIHIVEGFYAYYVSSKLNFDTMVNVKWMLQTFLCGFFSMRLLREIRERKQT